MDLQDLKGCFSLWLVWAVVGSIVTLGLYFVSVVLLATAANGNYAPMIFCVGLIVVAAGVMIARSHTKS